MKETWLINENLTSVPYTSTVNFVSNGVAYSGMSQTYISGSYSFNIFYVRSDSTEDQAIKIWYTDDSLTTIDMVRWFNQAYRVLTFDEAPTGGLLTWLQSNAVKQTADDAYLAKYGALSATADAIRAKGGSSDTIVWGESNGFADAVAAIPSGGAVQESDINFYDYDGTLLHAWTLAELAEKTALPELPTREGLTCQGWNWTLAELKAENGPMDVGANYITDDGKTRIYIHLEEGRTSPMVGLGVNGTVTVDWGDGSTPDTLTGTDVSTAVWTPAHSYAAAGDYVIKLTVTGSAELLGQASGNSVYACLLRNTADVADNINFSYMAAIRRVELGANIGISQTGGFGRCDKLAAVSLSLGLSGIGDAAFMSCYNLRAISIPPGATAVGDRFAAYLKSDVRVCVPPTLLAIGNQAFTSSDISRVRIPCSVKTTGYSLFNSCEALVSGVISDGITSLSTYTFSGSAIASADIRSKKIKILQNSTFQWCFRLAYVKIPPNIVSIYNNCFFESRALAVLDFTEHTAIPTITSTNALEGTADDLEIRVPASLADDWKAATNWATYADHIVGV